MMHGVATAANVMRRIPYYPLRRNITVVRRSLNQLTTTHAITLPTGESYSLSRDMNEIAKAFNQVRYRAGLPGLTQAQLESPTEMFEQIKRERMVDS